MKPEITGFWIGHQFDEAKPIRPLEGGGELAHCTLMRRLSPEWRRRLEMEISSSSLPKWLLISVKVYREYLKDGEKEGVHPLTAKAVLFPVKWKGKLRRGMALDFTERIPAPHRTKIQDFLLWVCHDYGGATINALAEHPLSEHLSPSDRHRAIRSAVARVRKILSEFPPETRPFPADLK